MTEPKVTITRNRLSSGIAVEVRVNGLGYGRCACRYHEQGRPQGRKRPLWTFTRFWSGAYIDAPTLKELRVKIAQAWKEEQKT